MAFSIKLHHFHVLTIKTFAGSMVSTKVYNAPSSCVKLVKGFTTCTVWIRSGVEMSYHWWLLYCFARFWAKWVICQWNVVTNILVIWCDKYPGDLMWQISCWFDVTNILVIWCDKYPGDLMWQISWWFDVTNIFSPFRIHSKNISHLQDSVMLASQQSPWLSFQGCLHRAFQRIIRCLIGSVWHPVVVFLALELENP